MMSKIHTIRQQHLHVELDGSESDGLALQRRLPDLCQTELASALERVFERYAPPNGQLTIERLEIDVGMLSLDRLEQDLVESVTQAVEKILRDLPQPDPAALTNTVTGNVQHKTERQSVLEAFLYFLSNGRLPWSFPVPEGENLEQALLDSWRETAQSVPNDHGYNNAIVDILAQASAQKRLSLQFSSVFLETLLDRLSPANKQAMDAILPLLRGADASTADVKLFTRQLWETAFAFVVRGNPISADQLVTESWYTLPMPLAQPAKLASVLERHWPGSAPTSGLGRPLVGGFTLANQKLMQAVLQALDKSDLTDFIKKQFEHHLQQIIYTVSPTAQTLTEHALVSETWQSLPATVQQATVANLLERHWPGVTQTVNRHGLVTEEIAVNESESIFSTSADTKEGIYIDNAGLVLLHPFLPQFFEALGVVAEGKLIQAERALCLLYFLTTGQTFAPEYELVLPKILCNIPLEAPVESNMELTDSEKEEAEALLEAVIRHWDALRNTGIDGLRGTFLLRFGKISLRNDDDWLLQVESKTLDILLNQLPWGVAMIKLPWMQRMLRVEWVN